MLQVKLVSLSFSSVLLRYYLMMAIIIGAGFMGSWAVGLLGLPIFISAILGVSVSLVNETRSEAKIYSINRSKQQQAV